MLRQPYQEKQVQRSSYRLRIYTLFVSILLCGALTYTYTAHLDTPEDTFPIGVRISITEGMTISEIGGELAHADVIRSPFFFRYLFKHEFAGEHVQAGIYTFPEKLSTRETARALIDGTNRTPQLRFTLPEGFRVRDLASLLPDQYARDANKDLTHYEGLLFPDTYFISSETAFDDIILLLQDTMRKKLEPYQEAIKASGLTEREVLILASLIEREAKDARSKKMVSGILQNRLEIGMPLQVDAAFDYVLDKASHELTEEDLELDSPFNTYIHTGLPPAPIANPGIESIEAVLNPIPSEYLYYLTGNDGTFYYAETFDEHKKNKARYLR